MRRWLSLAAGLFLALAAPMAHAGSAEPATTSWAAIVQVEGDDCPVSYLMGLEDDFFHGLKLVESADSFEFRKGATAVDLFPQQVTVSIVPYAPLCTPEGWPSEIPNPGRQIYQEGLLFDAYWERNSSKLSVAGAISVKQSEPEPWHEYRGGYRGLQYEITVPAQGVRLTDTLVLCVSTADRQPLTCIRGNLRLKFPMQQFQADLKTANPKDKRWTPAECFGDAALAYCYAFLEKPKHKGADWEVWVYKNESEETESWRLQERRPSQRPRDLHVPCLPGESASCPGSGLLRRFSLHLHDPDDVPRLASVARGSQLPAH